MADLLSNDPEQLAFLEHLIEKRNQLSNRPDIAIPGISDEFATFDYADHVLDQAKTEDEDLVIDLCNLDCMTLLEYVEAIRRSSTQDAFVRNLREIRYLSGNVNYKYRRHFFTTWVHSSQAIADDVTATCGDCKIKHQPKTLNVREDGNTFLTGVLPVETTVSYIPIDQVDDTVVSCIKNGDYIGIYSPTKGLDVSHVGLMVRHDGKPFFRHASSLDKYRQVVDHPFFTYIQGDFSETGIPRPGIVVYRARELH